MKTITSDGIEITVISPVHHFIRPNKTKNPTRPSPSSCILHPPHPGPPSHITAQHPTPNSTPVPFSLAFLLALPASIPPTLTPTLRNLHKRLKRRSGSSSPHSGQSQIGVKHGKPCKCGMLAGPFGWAAVKSGQVSRLSVGLQGWWSSSLGDC